MSVQSNDQGRAYEYISILTLEQEIKKIRPVIIQENSALRANKKAWDSMPENQKKLMSESAEATVLTIFDMEPMILEKGNDAVILALQTDDEGKKGDVRDILIIRKDCKWEIGLSIKHNHFAVKHSRLAKSLDFGQRWYNVPCSNEYWADIKPVFDYLELKKQEGAKWSELTAKETDVYIPLLEAFKSEVLRNCVNNPDVPQKMVEYLLGEFDFYKVISIDTRRITRIQTYNLHGKLNQPSKSDKPKIKIPLASLPTRIVNLDFKPNSNNTLELYMDGGWQFSFRIHNASTKVETSLKFDIQIVGMPAAVISIDCKWS